MRKSIIGILLLAVLSPFLFPACKGSGPSGPSGGSSGPTYTPTSTSTPSPTVTPSPTPNCTTVPDISVQINGLANGGITDILGNDQTDVPGLYLEDDCSTGSIFSFQVSSPMTLTFSLCPTENTGAGSYSTEDRDMDLAIRSGSCGSTSDLMLREGGSDCDLLPEIQSFNAVPGVEYYLVPMDYGGPGGVFDLRILSGQVPGVVCTVTPVSTPLTVSQGQQLTCATAYYLGTLGTGDSVATGHVDDNTNIDDYYYFVPANSGTVTVSLDCYDNGLNQADFLIKAYNGCPDSNQNFVAGSTAQTTVQSLNFPVTASAGVTYFIDVIAAFGGNELGNPYRLTVQTP